MKINIKNTTNYFFYPMSTIIIILSMVMTLIKPNSLYIVTDLILVLLYLYILQSMVSKNINFIMLFISMLLVSIVLKNLLFIDQELSQVMALNMRTVINEGKNILLIIFMMLVFSNEKNTERFEIILNNYSKPLKVLLISNQILQLFYLITRRGFVIVDGEVFFAGSIGYYHQFAYLIIFTTIITICLYKNNKIKNILMWLVTPTILIITSGARTATISYFFIVLVIFDFKINFKIDFKIIAFLSSIIIMFYLMPNNTFVEKMMTTSAQKSILSGREIFWSIDLLAYQNMDIFNQLFGKGIFFTRLINYKNYGLMIWAHNDFLELLICQGLVFLFLYTLLIIYFIVKMFRKNKIYTIFIILASFVLIYFNGFYIYTYSVLITPFLNTLIKEKI